MNLAERYVNWIEDLSLRLPKLLRSISIQRRRATNPVYTFGSRDPRMYFRGPEQITGRLTFSADGFTADHFIDEFVFNKCMVRQFELNGSTYTIHGLEITYHTHDYGYSPTWSADFRCSKIEVQRNSLMMEG